MHGTVAIVEDDTDIRELLAEVFESNGFAVVTVPDGEIGRIRHDCVSVDVFLIDLMLPRDTGIEVAARVRELFPGRHCLAMSASRAMLTLAAASGLFEEQFSKPFNLDALVDAARLHAGKAVSPEV